MYAQYTSDSEQHKMTGQTIPSVLWAHCKEVGVSRFSFAESAYHYHQHQQNSQKKIIAKWPRWYNSCYLVYNKFNPKMNRLTLTLALLLGCLAMTWAQSNVLKLNILSPIVKTFNVSYEKKVSPTGSLQLGFFYTGYSDGGESFKGFGITPEYRAYLSDTEAPDGFYVAPFVRYQTFDAEDDLGNAGTLSGFGGGLVIGRQWIFKEKFALDLFIGPSYVSSSFKQTAGADEIGTDTFDGFGLRFGVNFGLGF